MNRVTEVEEKDYTKELALEWIREAKHLLIYASSAYNFAVTGDCHKPKVPLGQRLYIDYQSVQMSFDKLAAEIEKEKEEVKV